MRAALRATGELGGVYPASIHATAADPHLPVAAHHAVEHELDVVEAFGDFLADFGAGHCIPYQEHADLVLRCLG